MYMFVKHVHNMYITCTCFVSIHVHVMYMIDHHVHGANCFIVRLFGAAFAYHVHVCAKF